MGIVSGGSGGGSQLLTDLGTVSLIALLAGPQTLYTPSNKLVEITYATSTVVVPDHQSLLVVQDAATTDPRFMLRLTNHLGSAQTRGLQVSSNSPPYVSSVPVTAGLETETSGYYLDEALGTWQSNHAYAAKTCISAAGHIWSSTAGTSGAVIPDFAGNIGGTVADNTVTWTDEGALPTTGSIHVYARVTGV